MALDYSKIASTTFASLGTYAATGGPGALAVGAFMTGPIGAAVGIAIAGFSIAASEIGKGRREADIIGPTQRQYGAVLTSVNETMSADPGLTIDQLNGMAQIVASGYAKFDEFTRSPGFTDGRASVQARDTIRPLVDGRNDQGQTIRSDGGTLGSIERRLNAIGGTTGASFGGGNAANPSGSSGSGGVLLVGGAIVAKILGFI